MSPNHAYYRANHGRWRAEIRFAITDRAVLSRLPFFDRVRIRCMVFLGPFTLETSVEYREDGIVHHTTRISKWKMAVYVAEETFLLDENGTDVAIERWQRTWPSPFRTHEAGESRGSIDRSGTRASYVFPMFGTTMRQTGAIEPEGVRLVQETDFMRSEQLLVRSRAYT